MANDRSATDAEFAAIPQVAPKPDEMPVGADAKNRYANVIPLPETRVTLSCRGGDPLSQYINANYVRVSSSSRCWSWTSTLHQLESGSTEHRRLIILKTLIC